MKLQVWTVKQQQQPESQQQQPESQQQQQQSDSQQQQQESQQQQQTEDVAEKGLGPDVKIDSVEKYQKEKTLCKNYLTLHDYTCKCSIAEGDCVTCFLMVL